MAIGVVMLVIALKLLEKNSPIVSTPGVPTQVTQSIPQQSGILWSITFPTNGATLHFPVTVRGTYEPRLLETDELWVFLQPVGGSYIPQLSSCDPLISAVVVDEVSGSWEALVDLDEVTTEAHYLKIVLFRTGLPWTDEFRDFLQGWCRGGNRPGLIVPRNYGLEPLVLSNVRQAQ